MLFLRGITQPLTERRTLTDSATLAEGMRLADDSEAMSQDPVLGVSAQAIEEPSEGSAPPVTRRG
jgi:hypothetical protein